MTGQPQSHSPESEHRIQSYIDSLLFESPQASPPVVEMYDVGQLAGSAQEGALQELTLKDPETAPVDNAVSTSEAVNPASAEAAEAGTATGDEFAKSAGIDKTARRASAFVRQLESVQRKGLQTGRTAQQAAERIDRRPEWGRDNFSCLTFNVSGLKLALPTEFIEGMQPLDLLDSPANDEFEFASPLFLGSMLLARGEQGLRSVSVVDTARVTMPERYSNNMRETYRYVLTLKDADWCIAVDSVGGELALASQQVRWRSEHTRREWLAGTVVDKMCALIDIDALDRHLLAERVLGGTD